MSKKAPEPEKENNERWLITYSDLITLLMVFFVVLYAMSSINAMKFAEMSQSLAIVFGQTGRSGVLDGGQTLNEFPSTHRQKGNLKKTQEQVRRLIARMGMDGKIVTNLQERGLVISVRDSVLFSAGSADLSFRATTVISELGRAIAQLPNSFRIEGHTDNDPISTSQFKSNWELSTARAITVLKFLVKYSELSPEKLSATGYAEYRPLTSNDTPAGKALNRRVDIVVLSEESDRFEPHPAEETSNDTSHNPE